jgi:uncharacterized protein YjbJ (UPF0337 family)
VTADDPNRTEGSWNQTAGAAKEFVGGVVGSEVCSLHQPNPTNIKQPEYILMRKQNLKQQGRDQNRQGQEQEAHGQIKDLGSGVGDRVTGAVGSAAAGLTGDRVKQAEYQDRHDAGKTQQRGVEHDLRKEAEARDGRSTF